MEEARRAWSLRWRALSPAQRRRILLGCTLGVALAARDLVLFVFAAGLFGLAEIAPARAPAARPSS